MRTRLQFGALTLVVAAVVVGTAGGSTRSDIREGGIFRVAMYGLDYIDPALAYTLSGWSILDTTCARLMAYPDKPVPEGLRLVPEVAAGFPAISRNGKTHTFTLRSGFRFSDGTPASVRLIARAKALARRCRRRPVRQDADGYRCHGAWEHARRPVHTPRRELPGDDDDAVLLCRPAVAAPGPRGPRCDPVRRPVRRHGVPARRAGDGPPESLLPRTRPHHVDGFDVDLRPSGPGEVLDRVERSEVDWGAVNAPTYFEPGRNLAAKFGVDKSRFFVRPGLVLRFAVFNTSRPLFRDNAPLRRAVNLALDRRQLARVAFASRLAYRLTDQYLPPTLPGFTDANIYPLQRANLARARAVARGNLRGGKAVLYVADAPSRSRRRKAVKQQLAAIGLDVELKPFPPGALFGRVVLPGEPWDLFLSLWAPDFVDPFQCLNLLFDGQYAGVANLGRFNSPVHNARMRRAGRIQGARRYEAYGAVDVQLARNAAPAAALNFLNEATLVSKRVGCIVLRRRSTSRLLA